MDDPNAGLAREMEARALQSLFSQLARRAARLKEVEGFASPPPVLRADDGGPPFHLDDIDMTEAMAAAVLRNFALRAIEQRLNWLADGLARIYDVDKAALAALAEAAIGAPPRLDDAPVPDRQLADEAGETSS